MNYQENYPKKKKRAESRFNQKNILLIGVITVIVIFAMLMFGRMGRLEPSDVVMVWNAALYDGDIELAEHYTSETSSTYIENQFGSVLELSQQYNVENRGSSRVIEEHINGNTAVVVYITCYADGSQKEWEDTLYLENGIWKLAPQYVQAQRITGAEC